MSHILNKYCLAEAEPKLDTWASSEALCECTEEDKEARLDILNRTGRTILFCATH